MIPRSARRAAHRLVWWAAAVGCLAVSAAVLVGITDRPGTTRPGVIVAPAPSVRSAPSATPAATPRALERTRATAIRADPVVFPADTPRQRVSDPLRVRVARLGIDAGLDPLTLSKAQELVPPDYGRAGWYADGPEPGEAGRAVIAGHVDSGTGPDVFAALRRARVGDLVEVVLAGGEEVRFQVREIGTFPRSAFPTGRVYGGSEQAAEIRLITCTGAYDRARGGYQSNLVVFGTLIA